MRLVMNGVLLSEHPDEWAIEQALRNMTGDTDVLTLHRPPADFMQATGSPSRGFILNAYDDARGVNLVSLGRTADAIVSAVLVQFMREGDWVTSVPGVQWQSGARRQEKSEGWLGTPGEAGLIAFTIFAVPLVAVGIAKLAGASIPLTGADLLAGLVAIALLAVYIGWLDIFFHSLRPRMAVRLGERLGVQIMESYEAWDAGSWVARGGTRARRVVASLLDFVMLFAGTFLPLGLPAVILFALLAK